MALERMRALVVGERRGAMLARGHATTLTAHEEAREPAAVVQQHGLLALLHHLIERIEQGLGEDRAATGDELAAQVGHDDLGQAGRAGALGHLDAGPAGAVVRAGLATGERLGRGRGGPQHQGATVELRKLSGDLTRMITRAAPLLVALLVLLIDDDETQVGKWAEERRARAHHHAGGA